MRAKTIDFESKSIAPILNRELTAVVLYEEGKDISPGDVLTGLHDGKELVEVHVKAVAEVPLKSTMLAVETLLGDLGVEDEFDLHNQIQDRYDVKITGEDVVRVIVFDTEPMEEE